MRINGKGIPVSIVNFRTVITNDGMSININQYLLLVSNIIFVFESVNACNRPKTIMSLLVL
ncbi:hypothetical protein BXY82_1808 [Gelidibacter sediminis]|uniref:Uncharacterized protein n=1 Tax=Gelidibacter sediminis TaxID=1608710 RepID=A0A4R7PXT1_9FLAO|nr:hypothetical protein BXY82_1808 [Gelidibacter sediminis]